MPTIGSTTTSLAPTPAQTPTSASTLASTAAQEVPPPSASSIEAPQHRKRRRVDAASEPAPQAGHEINRGWYREHEHKVLDAACHSIRQARCCERQAMYREVAAMLNRPVSSVKGQIYFRNRLHGRLKTLRKPALPSVAHSSPPHPATDDAATLSDDRSGASDREALPQQVAVGPSVR